MKVSKFENVKWIYSEELNVSIGIEENLPKNEYADVVYAKVAPKQILKKHYHKRDVSNAYEAFFFYEGGSIKILYKDSEETISSETPFCITFFDELIHGIENLSDEEVIFHVLCAPTHKDGEEVLI